MGFTLQWDLLIVSPDEEDPKYLPQGFYSAQEAWQGCQSPSQSGPNSHL